MTRKTLVSTTAALVLVSLASLTAFSQASPSQVAQGQPAPANPSAATVGGTRPAPHQAPCWQQAGISKSVMDQRRTIEDGARSEVEAVCTDSSLTPQQKQVKVKEIRQQARTQVEALIPAQQMQELKACNTQRGAAHPVPRPHPAGTGPCGESAGSPVSRPIGPASPPGDPDPKP